MIIALSVRRVVGGVPIWVECVFRRVDVVYLCLLYTQLLRVSFQLSSALQDVVLYESFGYTNNDSALSCTYLIAWMLFKLQCSLILQSSPYKGPGYLRQTSSWFVV